MSMPASVLALLALGCAAPEIRPVAGDVYVISSPASRYNTGKREDLSRQAEAFAAQQGKVAVAVPQLGSLSGIDRGGVVEYRFRLLDKDGSAAQAVTPPPGPEGASNRTEPATPAGPPAKETRPVEPTGTRTDLYNELIKLDDLRKRGILTDAEFQAQKKKLLDAPQR
jgi:hypothetical protein